MEKNVYEKVAERMALNPLKHIKVDYTADFLKEFFTEEEASLVADFPLGAYTPKELAVKMGRDEGELKRLLEGMDPKFTIFVKKRPNGENEYSVVPFEPGLMEALLMKGEINDETKKNIRLFGKLNMAEVTRINQLVEEKKFDEIGSPTARYLPIEEAVSGDTTLVSEEQLSALIDRETSFALGACACKFIHERYGDPCKVGGGKYKDSCVIFGDVADWLVERNVAKRQTKEEIIQKFKEFKEAGLMQLTINSDVGKTQIICNCCSCCCAYVAKGKPLRKYGVKLVANSLIAYVDESLCNGCGECMEKTVCHYQAMAMDDERKKAVVKAEMCAGCGVCVSKCPRNARSLVRAKEFKLKPPYSTVVGAGV